jgi:hypothetical protein
MDFNFLRLPTALLQFLTDHFGGNFTLASEYVRRVYTFQCHPAYQSGSAIYDWMNIKFNDNSICPCQLAAVVVLDDNPNNPERFALVVQAAVKCSHIHPSYLQNGVGQACIGPFHPINLILLVL